MTRQANLRHAYVEYIPDKLEPGVLYLSRKYQTASHLCCCGCGFKVVTPLNPAKWKVTDHGQTVSLFPSIGNWSFPCRSHYWIDHGRIQWAREMSKRQIAKVRRKDRLDAEQHAARDTNVLSQLGELLKRWFGGN
ncbi:MAG: DUF6527 family protein [Pseudohongiella sp.]|jgi:hypothetical protein|nr:DUF6527 family protein [Pseudohongiella sp.]